MTHKDKAFFGRRLPEVRDAKFPGKLFAIEGADGSGRSSQIGLLSQWLEANGYAVKHMGLRRSNLVSEELEEAKQGNVLTHTTMSLFYATDFFDQMVHEILPALRAGFIAGRVWGLSLERATQLGSAVATAAVEVIGTQEYDLPKESFLARFADAFGADAADEVAPHI